MHERRLTFAMKIGGDYRVIPHRNTWPVAAKELGLDPDRVVERVRELGRVAPDAFADAAKAPDVEALGRGLPDRLVGLVGERARRCLRAINAAGTRP